jgi:hypothetical protein
MGIIRTVNSSRQNRWSSKSGRDVASNQRYFLCIDTLDVLGETYRETCQIGKRYTHTSEIGEKMEHG